MNTKELSPICRQVRRDIITMTANAGSGHPGGSLSAVELMTSVFFNHMRVDPKNPHDPNRDRFVLSKGHAAPCYYAVLAAKGFISRDEYANFRHLHSLIRRELDVVIACLFMRRDRTDKGDDPLVAPFHPDIYITRRTKQAIGIQQRIPLSFQNAGSESLLPEPLRNQDGSIVQPNIRFLQHLAFRHPLE